MLVALPRIGAKARARQPAVSQAVGGAKTPSSKPTRNAAPHLAHENDMAVTSGRSGPHRTTVPFSVTILPASPLCTLSTTVKRRCH